MQFLGSVNFCSKFIEKLHINLKPLYTLLLDDVKFQWTPELEKIFRNVKNSIQKLSTLDRELLAIVYALEKHDFLIIGSPHPIYIFTDQKPLLHSFAKKGSPRFSRAQMQLTNFSKLKIIHTPGKNLTAADMLSRTFLKNNFKYIN